jgi:hypothetical protein
MKQPQVSDTTLMVLGGLAVLLVVALVVRAWSEEAEAPAPKKSTPPAPAAGGEGA